MLTIPITNGQSNTSVLTYLRDFGPVVMPQQVRLAVYDDTMRLLPFGFIVKPKN